jgi:hypothetical protein
VTSQIAKDARQRLAAFKVPERILFLKDLPKGISGKVQRRALRNVFNSSPRTHYRRNGQRDSVALKSQYEHFMGASISLADLF